MIVMPLRLRSEEQAFAEALAKLTYQPRTEAQLGPRLSPRVLFLDFDGVLNSYAFLRSEGFAALDRGDQAGNFDPVAVARLSGVVVELGLEVVISSSWRHGWDIDVLHAMLVRRGYEAGPFLGRTNPTSAQYTRGLEIQEWLDGARAVGIRPDPYAIVDDDADAGYGHEERFVRTKLSIGLVDADVEALRRSYLR